MSEEITLPDYITEDAGFIIKTPESVPVDWITYDKFLELTKEMGNVKPLYFAGIPNFVDGRYCLQDNDNEVKILKIPR